MNPLNLVSRIVPLALAATVLFLAGCNEDDSGNPTPTPTPTPSPTPGPTPTPTPSPTPTTSSDTSESTAASVASANARIMSAAAEDSLAAVGSAEAAFVDAGDPAAAREWILAARNAFVRSEISLSYPHPENAAELTALPDLLTTDSETLMIPGFDEILLALDHFPDSSDSSAQSDVSVQLETLEDHLREIAGAWKAREPGNFRNAIFLPDAAAPARIFQGLVAGADVLILTAGHPERRDMLEARLIAFQDILEGRYARGDDIRPMGPGVLRLVSETSRSRASEIRTQLDTLLRQIVDRAQDPPEAPAFEAFREQLILGAQELGYQVEDVEFVEGP